MPTESRNIERFLGQQNARQEARAWVEAARLAVQRGNADEAARLLRAAIQADPACVDAWLGLAWLADSRREREVLLRRVLELEPGHAKAQAELARLQRGAGPAAPPATGPRLEGRWALLLLALGAVILVLVVLLWWPVDASLAWLMPTATPTVVPTPTMTPAQIAAQFKPQLDAALAEENWDRALEIVEIMRSVDPEGEEVRQWSLATYKEAGRALAEAGEMEAAQTQFERAVALAPADAEALRWQEITSNYHLGVQALTAGEWGAAIELFTAVQEQQPDLADVGARLLEAYRRQGLAALATGEWTVSVEALAWVHERAPEDQVVADALADAYLQRGIARQEEEELEQARADLEAALALRPDDAEAQAHLDEVMALLFPPKRIEIDISQQMFYAWEGDNLVYKFKTSTGLPGRDTAVGHYKVLSKIPMAYSSIWRLKMPYWLGIYYVGRIENGIHALPIRPDGSVMWGGLLGQRASYGCIILSTQAAKTIFDWAELGTPVDIHY